MRIDAEMSAGDEATVVRGLLAFNEKWLGPSNDQRVRLVARDDHGVIGGLLGHTRWQYQARPFYEKLGYTLFGTLDGYPPGYRQFYLSKPLR